MIFLSDFSPPAPDARREAGDHREHSTRKQQKTYIVYYFHQ